MYLYGDCLTIHQAIEHFKSGQLKQIESPTRAGHHG
jgi:hypothetical protein